MIDLHIHSTFSDGTLTPLELIQLAEESGLSAIALCDHNTVAGLPEFMAAGIDSKVETVAGTEFSTDYAGTELHILALFLRPEHYGPVTQLLREMVERKDKSNAALIRALNEAGLALSYETIKASTPTGQVNRAVTAAEMVRLGYVDSVKEAFSGWLSAKHGYYQPPQRLDALEVIGFIRSLGAVSVLAHPFLNLQEQELRAFLPKAKAAGLDAMEAYYPLFDETQRTLALSMAGEYGLLVSGGSDFHGENKPDIRLGTGKENLHIPDGILQSLRSCK